MASTSTAEAAAPIEDRDGTFIRVYRERSHFNRYYDAVCNEYIVRIKDPNDDEVPVPYTNIYEWLTMTFDELIEWGIKNNDKHHMVGVKIRIPDMQNIRPIGLDFRPISSLSGEMLADLLQNVMQSNDEFSVTSRIEIAMTIVRIPSGGGSAIVKLSRLSKSNVLRVKSRSILVPNGKQPVDDLCLPRSLVLGKALADGISKDAMKPLVRCRSRVLKQKTASLIERAGVVIGKGGCVLNDIHKFSKVLKNYEIIIYDSFTRADSVLFKTLKKEKKIALFYIEEDKHFITIKNQKSFFGYQNQCEHCDKFFNAVNTHRCSEICSCCRQLGPCKSVETMTNCSACRRSFRGEICYQNHLTLPGAVMMRRNKKKKDANGDDDDSDGGGDDAPVETVCQRLSICRFCLHFIDTHRKKDVPHICSDKWCNVCGTRVNFNHRCYIQKYRTRQIVDEFVLVFMDIEASQDTVYEIDSNGKPISYLHKANLCVANQVCHLCYTDSNPDVKCVNCKERVHVFIGESCIKEFVDFVSEHRSYGRGRVTCITHNGKAYDYHMIMRELLSRDKSVKLIMGGQKILYIFYANHVRFIDSFNFIPMRLSKFVETFALDIELSKSDYPFLFNTADRFDYVGPLPGVEYYATEKFTEKEKEQFLKWHSDLVAQNYVFNNREELVKYCKNDVQLLQQGCVQYMLNFIKLANISPFLEGFTSAQVVLFAYRRNFMPPNSLGVTDKSNYDNTNQSVIARKWIAYKKMLLAPAQTMETEVKLSGAGNLIFDAVVRDGQPSSPPTILEFFGCFYHMHSPCKLLKLSNCGEKKKTEYDFYQRRERTTAKINKIKDLGFNIDSIYECEFIEFLKNNPEIHAKINASADMMYSSLALRDCLYGGRCEPLTLYYKAKPGERLLFFDIVSLYPAALKYGRYCLRNVTRIYKGTECAEIDQKLFELEGIIKCRVLPPRDMYIQIHSRVTRSFE